MNGKRYTYILYAISLVIVVTIGIQYYWNYNNYLSNKRQLINDVQVSLDKAVDDYYTNLAKETRMGLSFEGTPTDSLFKEQGPLSRVIQQMNTKNGVIEQLDSIDTKSIKSLTVFRGLRADSLQASQIKGQKRFHGDSLRLSVKTASKEDLSKIDILSTKIFISINNDSLNVAKVNTLLVEDLKRKSIKIDHYLEFFTNIPGSNTMKKMAKLKRKIPKEIGENYELQIESKSTFLPTNSALKLKFDNETYEVLKRSFGGILISTLLIAAVISCLFYLLKIIQGQKQLAEVKNDLISNITHEFKTPIATIGVALEGINNFNIIDDKAKTKQYIDMSATQLSKLNLMVEKLLETATLDSENLNLKKESIDILGLLSTLKNRHHIQFPEKTIETHFKMDNLTAKVDIFHFENALNNIVDNAIKYGGQLITIGAKPTKIGYQIYISDNGNNLTKAHANRIFEKFYRVPKGNTHDVKGFGIGLFYTKSIIEKHGGSISADLANGFTTFKINMPNG